MGDSDKRIQTISVLLILLALLSIGVGEYLHFAQLVGYALTVGGGGLGILTSPYLRQVNHTDSGAINVPAKE